MKELIKNSRVVGYLEKMYRELNNDKFNGELEECVITVQSARGTYGHVTCGKVWKVNGITEQTDRYELNVAAEELSRPIENVVATLLHEMTHIYNLMHEIQDCSRGGTYHNKKFKEKAESVGLHIEHDDKYGWTLTSPTEELIDYIIGKGWTDILLNRGEPVYTTPRKGGQPDGTQPSGKRPSSTRKYMCPCCRNSVRATKTVNIICADCNQLMQVV